MAFSIDYDPNSKEMLYAVHTIFMGDGLHFMGDRGMHKATNLFMLRRRKDARMINSVTKLIRKTVDE